MRLNAFWKRPARVLFNFRLQLRLHQAGGAFFYQLIEPDAVYKINRIQNVALGLGHLLAMFIANQAGDENFLERHFVGELQGHHDHARDPEKYDVEPGNQNIAGQPGFKRFGVVRPAVGRKWPQGRTEPGVQHIFILM